MALSPLLQTVAVLLGTFLYLDYLDSEDSQYKMFNCALLYNVLGSGVAIFVYHLSANNRNA